MATKKVTEVTPVPPELANKLAALVTMQAAPITSMHEEEGDKTFEQILQEAQNLVVDVTNINTTGFDNQDDQNFLKVIGAEILKVDAKADHIIREIERKVNKRRSQSLGPLVCAIQDRFGSTEGAVSAGLEDYWFSLGYFTPRHKAKGIDCTGKKVVKTLLDAAKAYRGIAEFEEFFVDGAEVKAEAILRYNDTQLATLQALPTEERFKLLNLAAEEDSELPTAKEIQEIAKQPEVKLSKAEERLQAALEKKRVTKEAADAALAANPGVAPTNPAVRFQVRAADTADKAVEKLEAQIEALKYEIEEQKLVAQKAQKSEAAAKKAEAEAYAELESMQNDDDLTRKRRINELSQTLTNTLPEVMSDLLKFFAEKDQYEASYRESITEHAQALFVLLKDKLDG